ncbi:MAG: AbiEi antitoxin N-terminal domain-containing protein [Parvularculaceae bacterium]
MSIARPDKIKRLLSAWEPHTVMTRARLKQLGITPQHNQKYVASGWVEAVGVGDDSAALANELRRAGLPAR